MHELNTQTGSQINAQTAEFQSIIIDACTELEIELDKAQVTQLIDYVWLLEKWNQTYNLTAIRHPKDMLYRHVIDALSICPAFKDGLIIADIGTGAGVPGIILAIVFRESQLYLVDSVGKKCRFLRQAVTHLGLNNECERVFIENERVEQFCPTLLKGVKVEFDFIICRAFTSLANFTTITRHLGTDKTQWLAMKANDIADEKSQLPTEFEIIKDKVLKVPFEQASRRLIWIKEKSL